MPRSPNVRCPLGFDNSMCFLPKSACENYRFCELQSFSWGLPYYFADDGSLVVNCFARLYRFYLCTIPNRSIERSSYCAVETDDNFQHIILTAWKLAGWDSAVRNKNFVLLSIHADLEVNFDPIPF